MRSTDIIFVPVLVIAWAVATDCNRDANEPSDAETKVSAATDTKLQPPAGPAAAGMPTESSREFLLAAASAGMLEVEAGKLAEGRAQTEPVKQFARMMVDHHTRANDELAKLAKSMSIDVPNALDENGQDKLEDLRGESGRDFDEEYIDLMIDEHRRVIRNFEREADRNDDPQPVRSWASQTLPTLRSHLEQAKLTEKDIDEAPAAAPSMTAPDTTRPPAPDGSAGSSMGTPGSPPEAGGSQPASPQPHTGSHSSGDTKSGDTKSGDTKSGDTKSGDTKSGNTKSGNTKSGNTKSGNTKSGND